MKGWVSIYIEFLLKDEKPMTEFPKSMGFIPFIDLKHFH